MATRALTGEGTGYGRFFSLEFGDRPEGGMARCPFITLCPNKMEACGERTPGLIDLGEGRKVRCIIQGEADG